MFLFLSFQQAAAHVKFRSRIHDTVWRAKNKNKFQTLGWLPGIVVLPTFYIKRRELRQNQEWIFYCPTFMHSCKIYLEWKSSVSINQIFFGILWHLSPCPIIRKPFHHLHFRVLGHDFRWKQYCLPFLLNVSPVSVLRSLNFCWSLMKFGDFWKKKNFWRIWWKKSCCSLQCDGANSLQ